MTAKMLRISPELALPLDAVTSTTIVYGGKGMGKTNFGSVLVEEMTKAALRWCVIDPMGVWWGLRYSADGKGPGIECLILGGAHGDIPIEPTGGAVVADLVVDEGVNTIIDISRKANGMMWSAGERIRFVTDYTIRLFERQGELVDGRRREPIIQFLDEAARYIPQTIPSGAIDIAKCVGAWEQVCEEGRNIGLGVGFLTQRSARMNKSVSELADVMFAFRTIGPRSLAAVMDWLGEHVEKERIKVLGAEVRTLNIGQALVVSPGWLRVEKIAQIRPRETFDSSATPKPGQQARRVTGKAAKPDLASYQARMAETIERAKATDPKLLQKRIAELEKQLAKAPSKEKIVERTVVDERATQRAVAQAVKPYKEAARSVRAVWNRASTTISQLVPQMADVLNKLDAESPVVAALPAPSTLTPVRPPVAAPRPVSTVARHVDREDGGAPLGKGERTILAAIAQYDATSREQLTVLTGYKRSSRDTYVQRLIARGFAVVDSNGNLVATAEGIAELGDDYKPLPTGAALRRHWLDELGGGEREILQVLIDAGGEWVTRDYISEHTEYKRSSRDTYLQRLAARMLAETGPGGTVRASRILFE